jgi:protein involved in polysaccharide export with SLBB domain
MTRSIGLLFALLATLAYRDARAQVGGEVQPPGLNPGDQIRIQVWRRPELSGDFPVAANGTVVHPLYREVQVTGIPLSAVEDRLRTFLSKYETNPQFVIQPLVKVVVSGEVRSPGLYSVPPELTIAQALILAGGAGPAGQLDKIRVLREGQQLTIDLTKPNSEAVRIQIRSGDQIIVPRGRSVFRDVVGPAMSSAAALGSLINIILFTVR